jgi:hypothetical protein
MKIIKMEKVHFIGSVLGALTPLNFFKSSTKVDAHKYIHTLTPINAAS